MSNSATAEFLAENITEHLRYIWLCHLSKDNNHPELAYKTVEWKLKNKGVIVGKDVQLLALKRNTPSELLCVRITMKKDSKKAALLFGQMK